MTEEEVGATDQARIALTGWERSLSSRVDLERWSQDAMGRQWGGERLSRISLQ